MIDKEKEYLKEWKKFNRIMVMDFEVESTEASLKEVKETMNDLIKKHKSFAIARRRTIKYGDMVG